MFFFIVVGFLNIRGNDYNVSESEQWLTVFASENWFFFLRMIYFYFNRIIGFLNVYNFTNSGN
jgi:hypothetical protein